MTMVAWRVAGVLMLTAAGCARPDWIEQTLVTVDVSGEWRGSYSSSSPGVFAGNRPVALTLKQDGPKVTGQITIGSQSEGPVGALEGTISGDIFSFHDSRDRLTGRLQVNGDEMTGLGAMSGFSATITLRRQP